MTEHHATADSSGETTSQAAFPELPRPVADPFAAAGDSPRGDAQLSVIAGERASQGPGNKIVTYQRKTHLAWQDSHELRYFARVRSLDNETGTWTPSVTLTDGVDEHSRPALAIDSQGYLHVVMGGHNTPLQYRRSVRPNDSSEWTPIEPFGKNTYPVLLCGPDDTLYLAAREGGHAGMELWVKPSDGSWESRGLLVARQERFSGYTAMHNDLAWSLDRRTLHMSMGFFLGRQQKEGEHPRDVAGTYQAVGYMRSHDFGATWGKADGTPVPLPATSDTVDLLAEAESNNPKPGIQHCGIAVDSQNRPYLAYVRHTPTPCQGFLMTHDEAGAWRRLDTDETVAKQWPGWGLLGCKPVMTDDDVLCILANLVPLERPGANWSPGVFGRPAFWLRDYRELHRIVWLESTDYGETFTAREVLEYDPHEGQVMPSIERPNGPNRLPAGTRPSFIYALGEDRYAEEGETIDNELWWVRVPAEGGSEST